MNIFKIFAKNKRETQCPPSVELSSKISYVGKEFCVISVNHSKTDDEEELIIHCKKVQDGKVL